jgi:hypothetical protein
VNNLVCNHQTVVCLQQNLIQFNGRAAGLQGFLCEAICAITGQRGILDNDPVLQKSIALRNPYTDVLNLLQIELLRR